VISFDRSDLTDSGAGAVGKRPNGGIEEEAWDVRASDTGERPAQMERPDARDVCVPDTGERPNGPQSPVDWDVCARPSAWPDRVVAEIAGRQHGLIARRQLVALGLSRGLIDNMVRRGRLIAIHRGVYALAHSSMPPFAPYMAAVLAVGEDAWLSHRSAATVWGLLRGRDDDVEITLVGRDSGRRRAGVRVHRAITLDPRDTTHRHNIPIVSAARALLDITPDLGARDLERAFDGALKAGIVSRDAVARTAGRAHGHPGAARLSDLARDELRAPADTESDPEEDLRRLIGAGGLPQPEYNVQLGPYRVDALWRAHRLVVEVDGYAFHSTHRSFEGDHERDLKLGEAGFVVMRFTRDQVVHKGEWVLVKLAQRLARLDAQLGRSSLIVS
jgi:very-short-patch-repair endonuclease